MAVSIACISGKGGVGKTTTTINVAAALAEQGRRVLAVDCDPQSNLTSGLGFDPYRVEPPIGHRFTGTVDDPLVVVHATRWERLDVLPATPDLSAVEAALPSQLSRELILRNVMSRNGLQREYEFILHDTPPNIKVFDRIIKHTVKLQETSLAGVPITAYASSSDAATAYRSLAGEIVAHV